MILEIDEGLLEQLILSALAARYAAISRLKITRLQERDGFPNWGAYCADYGTSEPSRVDPILAEILLRLGKRYRVR